MGGAAVAALALGTLVAAHSPLFAARHVTVTGAVHESRQAVLRAGGLMGSPPLFDVSSARSAAAIEALPWVQSATVDRRFPDGLTVSVTERTPLVAMSRRGGASALVDGSGRVLSWSAGAPPAGTIVLIALVRVGAPGTHLTGSVQGGLAVAQSLGPAGLEGKVQQVVEAADGSVTLVLAGGVRALLGQAEQVGSKLDALASVLAGAAPAGAEIIDLRVPGEPTVAAAAPHP